MTPTRMALHNLAHELHMTVGNMTASMTPREFGDWVEWFARKNAAREEPQEDPAPAPGAAFGMRLDLTTPQGVRALSTMFDKGKGAPA